MRAASNRPDTCLHPTGGHQQQRFPLRSRGRSLIAALLSTTFDSLLLPLRGHGSLRSQHMPPQHLVRSADAAMSTTDSRATYAVQRPPSQPACTLAPVGNSHSHQHVARVDLVKVLLGGHNRLGPAERFT
jgi:hypothetical protein